MAEKTFFRQNINFKNFVKTVEKAVIMCYNNMTYEKRDLRIRIFCCE